MPPDFFPDDTEDACEIEEHRYLYIKFTREHAGHVPATLIVSDFDDRIAQIADQGIEPTTEEDFR